MIQRISSIHEFLALKPEWDRLYAASGLSNLFLTHDWLSNWLVHFGKNDWIVLIECAEKQSDIQSVVLFIVSNRHVRYIGNQHSYFPGFLTSEAKTGPVRSIMDYLINEERCRSLLLTECPDDFSFEHELRKESGNEWIVVKKNPKILRSINLSGDFESYLDGRNKKLRHELFRKAKKLQKSGITTLKCFQKENDVNEVFEIINDIENDSWKFKCGTAIISSEQETSFYRSLYRMYARNFSARTYVLELNRVPLAYVMGVVFDHTYYALKTSYKEAYKKLSPGALLFSKTIESLMCNNSKEKAIELLGEDSRWKAELSTDRRELCTYQLYPRCLKNICYLAGRKYIKEIRKLVQYIHTGP